MSLVRKLAAGKSLVGIREGSTRFRFAGRGMLPSFGGRTNPFLRKHAAESGFSEPPPPSPAAQPGPGCATGGPEPASPPVQKSPKQGLRRMVSWGANLIDNIAFVLKETAERITRMVPRRKRTSAIPQLPRVPVQRELSLDRVKVVRNDLSDSDVEVVPAKSLVGGTAGSGTEPAGGRGTPANQNPFCVSNAEPGRTVVDPNGADGATDLRLGLWPAEGVTEKDAGSASAGAA